MASVILHLLEVSDFSYMEIAKALDMLDFPIYRISEAEYLYLLVYLDCDLMEFIEGYDIRKPLYKRGRNLSNSIRAEQNQLGYTSRTQEYPIYSTHLLADSCVV